MHKVYLRFHGWELRGFLVYPIVKEPLIIARVDIRICVGKGNVTEVANKNALKYGQYVLNTTGHLVVYLRLHW